MRAFYHSLLLFFALANASTVAFAQQKPAAPATAVPDTEIYLATLTNNAGKITLGKPTNITNRTGYDNQPSFTPDGKKLLYTQQTNGQTDIWSYDLAQQRAAALTQTPESEYSATVTPDGTHFSVIRVEADQTQRLWQFDLSTGQNPQLVLKDLKPVGYHRWFGADTLVLFVLGSPNTLQVARVSTGQGQTLTTNIGRSLHQIPKQSAVSFVQKTSPTTWHVARLDMHNLQISKLIETPTGSEDCAWTPDGTLLMAQGAKLYKWNAATDKEWQLMADLSSANVKQITRLAVSPTGNQLAFVAQ